MPPPPLRSLLRSRSSAFICRSCASRGSISQWRPLARAYSSGPKSFFDDDTEPYTAKHFEEDEHGNRVQIDPQIEDSRIRKQLDRINKVIEILQKPASEIPGSQAINDGEDRTTSTLDALLADIQQEEDASKQFSEKIDVEIPLEPFPKERHLYITRLNNALRPAAEGKLTDKTVRRLWQRYSLCSRTLSSSWSSVPRGVWQCLWNAFFAETPEGTDRMAHLRQLAMDMQAAGIELTPQQHMVFIEALFIEGLRAKAVLLWEKHEDTLGSDPATAQEYWEMGVMMLSHLGEVERAQAVVDKLLESPQTMKDRRVLLHIIKAWLFSQHDASLRIREAWKNYVSLRRCLGASATMKDYDEVILFFLHANRPDLALAVFKDMMLGQIMPSGERIAPSSYGTIDAEQLVSAPDPSDMSWPQILKLLPIEHRNKYFFGKWIKKLIGDGEIDGAVQVTEMMRMAGLRPDAKYMNGIIGAWIRSGSSQARDKAEESAWKMIQARLKFVESRKLHRGLQAPLRAYPTAEHKLNIKRPVAYGMDHYPRATPETFAILIEEYRRRGLSDKLETVFKTMQAAEVPTNTSLMNQHILTCVRLHQAPSAWGLYNKYVNTDGVRPDVFTYHSLWKLMKARSDRTLNRTRAGYPSCRTLFAEMMKHKEVLNVADKRMPELYDLIVLSFGLSDDQMGTAVALQAMQDTVGVPPTQGTLRSVVLQLSKVGMLNEHGFKPRRLNLNSATKARISEVTQIMKSLQERRQSFLVTRGVDVEALDEESQSRETMIVLNQLLGFAVYSRARKPGPDTHDDYLSHDSTPEIVKQLAEVATNEMGVPECNPFSAL